MAYAAWFEIIITPNTMSEKEIRAYCREHLIPSKKDSNGHFYIMCLKDNLGKLKKLFYKE